ncbi:hypothetical protein [Micromonospora sp. NPDC050200]|uniref:hypothetical protein n=1 Tax=Micromonospora sp. NPDC050200 TaxID=3155664 RepID=UPI0033E1FDDF
MRFGGRTSARVRRGLLAAAVVMVLAVTVVTVAVPLLRDRSQQRLERRADREVTAIAQRARAELLADPAAGEAALRLAADRVDGVEVLAVEGGGQRPEAAVRLVFRVRVAKPRASSAGSRPQRRAASRRWCAPVPVRRRWSGCRARRESTRVTPSPRPARRPAPLNSRYRGAATTGRIGGHDHDDVRDGAVPAVRCDDGVGARGDALVCRL